MSTTTPQATATRTSLNYAPERPPADGVVADVLVAVWCRSVGACWTLELYQLERDTSPRILTDWINSGVPISQPAPDALVDDLLAGRGLELFRDPSAGPCTHNRHGIGYVSTNTEVIRQAHLMTDEAAETRTHPVVLGSRGARTPSSLSTTGQISGPELTPLATAATRSTSPAVCRKTVEQATQQYVLR